MSSADRLSSLVLSRENEVTDFGKRGRGDLPEPLPLVKLGRHDVRAEELQDAVQLDRFREAQSVRRYFLDLSMSFRASAVHGGAGEYSP